MISFKHQFQGDNFFISKMAPNENLTAVLHGIEDLRLENYDIPNIEDNGDEIQTKHSK